MRIKAKLLIPALIIASGLLGGPWFTAQVADAQPGAPTNSTGAGLAEDPGAASNAAALSATNETSEKGRGGLNREAMVVFGKDAELKAGESAEVVVAIGGSAKAHGKVRDTVTAIFGDVEVDGEVGHEVVAVLGDVKVRKGATIHGEVVAVGGKVEVEEGATIEGHTQEVDFGALGLPAPKWLRHWFVHCVLLLRPLAPQVGWVWAVAGGFFLFYLLVAMLFPRPVQASLNELTQRPATTFFLGLLTMPLLAVVLFILAVTVIGLLVVPFLLAAVVFGALVGKIAFLESLGFRIARHFGAELSLKPLGALVIGFILIALLYLVPVLGLLTFCMISVWGLGGAVTAAFAGMRREAPEKRPAATPAAAEPAMAASGAGEASPAGNPGTPLASGTAEDLSPASEAAAQRSQPNQTVTATPPAAALCMAETLTYPRASFWERMAAGFLDFVLVGILCGIAHPFGNLFPLVALAYFAGMWAWKGTTVGAIVIGLKVARVDGQPVTFAVALVRALAGAFSIMVLFMGFFWIAWDPEKQGWHDKIAGTMVLKLPRGTPLVCL